MFAPVEVWFLSTLSQLCFHIRRLEWPFLVVHGGKKSFHGRRQHQT